MLENQEMVILGQGVWSPFYVGSSMDGIEAKFGRSRVIDTPVSENAVTGMGFGLATKGITNLVIHPRMDFMILAMDSLVNAAAKWRYSLSFKSPLPMTVRAIINRGGEQGAQHSQALHSWFAHIPGLRVVMPGGPKDAYFLLRQALDSPDPVIFIEDRWSYDLEEFFDPSDSYGPLALEKSKIIKEGTNLTLVGIGHSVNVCREALDKIQDSNQIELIDLRIINPFDAEVIVKSVEKTGKLMVVDGGWKSTGLGSEVIAAVSESIKVPMRNNPIRITLPAASAPTSRLLEKSYYLSADILATRISQYLEEQS
jgi:pyruvate dehydrogenase E1 component beta subunit